MRQIEIEEDLRIRFPNRSEDFDDGVETGIAIALMTVCGQEFVRPVAAGNLEQLRAVAAPLGYHLVSLGDEAGRTIAAFRSGRPRPALTLVHSGPADRTVRHRTARDVAKLSLAKGVGAPERADRVQIGQIS